MKRLWFLTFALSVALINNGLAKSKFRHCIASKHPTLTQSTKKQVILAQASGDIENNGSRCRALLTQNSGASPEGEVFLQVLRFHHGTWEPRIKIPVGEGSTATLIARDLTGDRNTEVFVFVDGQATYTSVFRFSSKTYSRLLTLEVGRPEVECRRQTNGKWAIIEHGPADWYDDVPPRVAQRARALAKPHYLPSVVHIYLWNPKRHRFTVHSVVAE